MTNDSELKIRHLLSDEEILAGIPLIRVLRPLLEPDDSAVLHRVKRQMVAGYRLVAIMRGTRPVALAGYRLTEDLVHGQYLYVDDLVVMPEERKQGHAERLLDEAARIAREVGYGMVALDTGLDNIAAQSVYRRCGYEIVAYHLIRRLDA